MAATQDPRVQKTLFVTGVGGNVLLLASLKFLPVLSQGALILVTIGLSYFVFQAISYLIDLHLEILEPERHFGYFFLSLAFFPKLLQGPIERSGDLLPQLRQPYAFNYDNIRSGALLFGWGLFKKIVIADRLAVYVNTVYGDVHAFSGLPLLFATYLYALQIYFDFSGYTDMALGTARLFNIRLTQNFNSPYLANSIADFWRRWHISFSRWILDYIFKPLQMSWRTWGSAGAALALMVTFLLSGLWHGVAWGFVLWGGLHGLYMACAVFWRPYQKKLHKKFGLKKSRILRIWQIAVTFHLVTFAWIFFRAQSLDDAFYVTKQIGVAFQSLTNSAAIKSAVMAGHSLANLKALVLAFLVYSLFVACKNRIELFAKPVWFRWSCYLLLALTLTLLSETSQYSFVYYQF